MPPPYWVGEEEAVGEEASEAVEVAAVVPRPQPEIWVQVKPFSALRAET